MPPSPRRSGYQARKPVVSERLFQLRGVFDNVIFSGELRQWRGVGYHWDGTGPTGVVRLFTSDNGTSWEPWLMFEGDGVRLRPLPCQGVRGGGLPCLSQAGHRGKC